MKSQEKAEVNQMKVGRLEHCISLANSKRETTLKALPLLQPQILQRLDGKGFGTLREIPQRNKPHAFSVELI